MHSLKVFLSHSHRAKALPLSERSARTCPNICRSGRTVRSPDSADINVSIRNAIQEEADFVIIFLGREAMTPEWVRREFEWALEREKFLANNS